jgi:ribosomal-protein-alanine N-acetyltransferase
MTSKLSFEPFPELSTIRYNLRKLELGDSKSIYEIRSDKLIAKYIDRPMARSVADAEKFIEKVEMAISSNEAIYWGIEEKCYNKIIGTITLWQISSDGSSAEIGFELLPKHHGTGVMQEIIPVVLDFAFSKMGLLFIEGEVDKENVKSKMLLKKYGFNLYRQNIKTEIFVLSSKSFNC